MGSNEYHFITRWRIDNVRREEVFDILSDAEGLKRWWPSVYLDVVTLEQGDANGVGTLVDLYTKGWLPYTLRWRLRITESDEPRRFALVAEGDFVGRGVWTFVQVGNAVEVTYDWQIRAEKPLLKALTPILRPVFEANHRWAMKRGEESLRLELARRRAPNEPARQAVPPPPPPTTSRPFVLGLGATALVAAIALWVVLRPISPSRSDVPPLPDG
ncbi:MAG: hypothetical protein KatS3mg060_3485 [Dehalococcoidia bacterium]|nr:MAG: hypothetical protein KatS3mg060_3485 [Dehalococcoidia bacterium]